MPANNRYVGAKGTREKVSHARNMTIRVNEMLHARINTLAKTKNIPFASAARYLMLLGVQALQNQEKGKIPDDIPDLLRDELPQD